MITHVLFESASGYAVFEAKLAENIALKSAAMQSSVQDLSKFGKMVGLMSFMPFKSAAQALENINDVSEGILNDYLKNLLELTLSKPSKKSKVLLAVSDSGLGTSIKEGVSISCTASEEAQGLIRGIRLHATKLLKGLQTDDIKKAQLGLGHSYSRAKLKFNVNRIDNMIIQAIALLDQLDKDVNLFSMRIREWYGYHFPELVRIVPDNQQYARVALFIGDKDLLDEEKLPELTSILDNDSTLAQNILDAARGSMGSSLSEIDMFNISAFATRVVSLSEYRKSLISYLSEKMNVVAPSLTALLGERIGARLISHAGSLTNLSKYAASTVQILGAEKALFRALKTKGNTPKYGLLYHSSFIGRAKPEHKGRISRFLANKCSIAARIDCYTDHPTSKFGEALRSQVEERLTFFDSGQPPSKNADAMHRVIAELALDNDNSDDEGDAMDVDGQGPLLTTLAAEPPSKKEKAHKKEKKSKKDKNKEETEETDKKGKKDTDKKDKKDKDKKDKKRKSGDMDTDEDGRPAVKKVKLSKEEKKALKKAKKEKVSSGPEESPKKGKEKKDKGKKSKE